MQVKTITKTAGLGCGLILSILLAGCGGQGANSALMGAGLKANPGSLGKSLAAGAATIPTTHVLSYDYFADGAPAVSFSQAAPWVTWVMATAPQSVALKALGVKTGLYTNPNRTKPGSPMYTSDESTFAHDCSGNRLMANNPNQPGFYLMDPHSSNLATLWHNYAASVGGQFDAVFEDTSDHIVGASALPCNYTESDWTAATNQMATNANLGHGVLYNELAELSKSGKVLGVSPIIALNQTSIGGMMEGCYSSHDDTSPKPRGGTWVAYENTEIAMAQQQKSFLCIAGNMSPAASSIDLRTYYTASYLMTYDLGTTVLGEKFATPSGFHAEPESELVATNPVVPTPSDISSLMISTNVYGREYGACYIAGVSVGPCAVAVNTDAAAYSHPFPWGSKYQHTLALSGGGILDGGTISADGPAPASSIPGNGAVIAFGIATVNTQPTLGFTPGTQTAPTSLFYKMTGETGAISQEMDPTATGTLTNEALNYKGLFAGSFGWVSGPGQPGLTPWAAAKYNITLNVTQPNAALQITDVRIYRVDANGGPNTSGLALVGELPALSQSLGTAGSLSFSVVGSTQLAGLTDRLAVRFQVKNVSTHPQSFSYDAGTGALSTLSITPQ